MKTLSIIEKDWVENGKGLPRRDTIALLRIARTSCRIRGRVVSGRRSHTVIIRNFSQLGALISGGRMPRAGENVVLEAKGMRFAATVMWMKWPRYGLMFRDSVDREVVEEMLKPNA